MKIRISKNFKIKASLERVPELIDWVRETLLELKVPQKEVYKVCLPLEDILVMMINKAETEAKIKLNIEKFLGSVRIHMSCRGESFTTEDVNAQLIEGLDDDEAKSVMLKLLDRVMKRNINVRNNAGLNICDITVFESPQKMLYYIIGSLLAGIFSGLLMKLCLPADIIKLTADNFFGPVNAMFLNALKTVVGPLVFFSIASSISGYSDLKSLGKVAAKVLGCYIVTSFIAIAVGYSVYQLFPIGDTALAEAVTESSIAANAAKAGPVSIKDVIVNIVPSDIVSPFLHMDMLQIIFLAVLIGIAASLMAGENPMFNQLIDSCNKAFSKVISIIMLFIPLAVFCSIAKMVVSMELVNLVKMIQWVPVCYLGHAVMLGVYILLLTVLSGYNPVRFFKGFMPAMVTAFSTSSSSITMPISLKCCREGLKIDPKIYSFSIPLGTTINMDGTCVVLMITALFTASIFQIPVTGDMLVSLVIAIMALSMGAPAVPGGALICMAVLFPIIGVPAEAVSLFIGIYPIVSRSLTMTNVTGDAAVTVIVAKSEKMLQLDK